MEGPKQGPVRKEAQPHPLPPPPSAGRIGTGVRGRYHLTILMIGCLVDIGRTNIKLLFISCCSHGHVDHTSGVVHHSSRRNMYSMKPATYHMLPLLIEPMKKVAAGVSQVHGGEDNKFTQLNLNPVTENDTIQVHLL